MAITVSAFVLGSEKLEINVKCFPDILSERLSAINTVIGQHL